MVTNIGNHAISERLIASYDKAGFVAPNAERDMAYYDALPRQVREAMDEAPWAISTEAAYHCVRTHGLALALKEIRESADAFYAAFEAETGVPRPRKALGGGAGVKLWRR